MRQPIEMLSKFLEPDEWLKKLTPTAQLKLFGLMKIPLLFLVNPKVVQMNGEVCEVKIPLNYMTKNHLGSMYFGTMAVGADCVVAMHALHIAGGTSDISVVFKDFHAEFLKRAESDVIFRCEAGERVKDLVRKAKETRERVTEAIPVEAFVLRGQRETVAKFTLGLSLKAK
jgi:acyl-coenzyme A thioesterase PaaI-like protein